MDVNKIGRMEGDGGRANKGNFPSKEQTNRIPPEYIRGNVHSCIRATLPAKKSTERPMANRNWSVKFIKPSEVVIHNQPWDCWISMNGIVKDLTPLVEQYLGNDLVKPILAHAGKDISHWFDKNGDLQTFIHPVTGLRVHYLPHGCIPEASCDDLPHADWEVPTSLPWWKDISYNVARLTANVRPIRIFNLLAGMNLLLHVCEEETINEIKERYRIYNSNADSYTWKFEGEKVDMDKTLTGNNIRDLREMFRTAGIPDHAYVPCLMLSYNDDFKLPET